MKEKGEMKKEERVIETETHRETYKDKELQRVFPLRNIAAFDAISDISFFRSLKKKKKHFLKKYHT